MADKTGEEVLSTQLSQGSHDRGWNDPPKWAYSPNSTVNSGSTPTKRLLNKRVAFPMSSSTASIPSSHHQPPSGNLPPPPVQLTHLTTAPHAPLLAPTGASMVDSESLPEMIDRNETLSRTVENLEFVMSTELEGNGKIDEIKKRLEIMKNLWNEEKFNDEIMHKVFLISEELRSKNVDKAAEIHVSLIMNHAKICSNGISVVRHLIYELREKYSQPGFTLDSNTGPLLLFDPSSTK